MLFSTLLVFLTFGITSAAPLSNDDTALTATSMVKRTKKTSNCGLSKLTDIGQGALREGIWDLLLKLDGDGDYSDEEGEVVWGIPGKCKMFWCRGKVNFGLCLDKETDTEMYSPKKLGQEILDTYKDCNSDEPGKSDTSERAFQYWGKGYSLLIQGDGDCDKIGSTWEQKIWDLA